MATFDANALAAQVETQADAQTLITTLMSQFNLVGTTFCAADIEGALADAHFPATDEADLEAVIGQLMDTYQWRKMGDILAERGNEALGEAAREATAEATKV